MLLWRNHLWAIGLKEEVEVGGLVACIAWIFRPSVLRKIIELHPQLVRRLHSKTLLSFFTYPFNTCFSQKLSFSVWMNGRLLLRMTRICMRLQVLHNKIWRRLDNSFLFSIIRTLISTRFSNDNTGIWQRTQEQNRQSFKASFARWRIWFRLALALRMQLHSKRSWQFFTAFWCSPVPAYATGGVGGNRRIHRVATPPRCPSEQRFN